MIIRNGLALTGLLGLLIVPGAAGPAGPAYLAVGLTTNGELAIETAAGRPSQPQSRAGDTRLQIGIARDGGGYTTRTMALEEYVAGVLSGEAAADSSPAALEALAITIRTFALANRGRHRAEGFDLCDLTHCQVLRKGTPATGRAAAATAGKVLLYEGVPASVFYTASCGGWTERPSQVWPGASDVPFLPSREDDACERQPAWVAEIRAADLIRSLHAGGFKGDVLRDLEVAGRSESGRVTRLRLNGLTPDEISGQDLRTIVGRRLGWQHIKSTAFDVRRSGSGFYFAGHGSGHGVGLCVIGSARLAERRQSAEQILGRYFPGLQIAAVVPAVASVSVSVPQVLVSMPEADQREHEVIQDLAVRAREALTNELGTATPARITLRFHPTVQSYQRATGQPWFTAGATNGTDVQLLPLVVLRERGVLDRTIRHEMVHVLTDSVLAGRPLWVREGAASYFARERETIDTARSARDSVARRSCPTDRELLQPLSPGALSTAYARSTACFARQIESGKKWNEVK